MARNVQLVVLRGLKANLPALAVGEHYFATDTLELFVGGSPGPCPVGIPVFNASGVRQQRPHIVVDRVTLPSGGSSTVTLPAASAFTSGTSYVCVVAVNALKRTLQVVQNSGTSFTVSGGGTGDVVGFICIGT